MKIEANRVSMNYELAGSGKCLTLIHGAGDNLNMWYNQVPVFSKNYRVLTYDVRGHGQTETPEGELTNEVFTQDIYGLLKALNISESYVLGYSMGGGIGLRLAIEHPEMVKALILAASGAGVARRSEQEMSEWAKRLQTQVEMVEKHGLAAIMDESTAMAFSPGFAQRNKEAFERYKATRLQNDPKGYLKIMRSSPWQAPPPDVTKLKCPTLIIAGEHDAYMGAEGAKASQRMIAGSQLKIMPTGHAAAIEEPEMFNSVVLDFLARLA